MAPLPRWQFPVADHLCYLNHAGIAPLPRAAVEAMALDAEDSMRRGSLSEDDRQDQMERVRVAAARLMGVDPDDVAFIKNTTEGLAFVANGLDWEPGDRVVVPDLEFPSTVFPWMELADRRGVELDVLAPVGSGATLPLERFAAALTAGAGRVRVVALSWVQFSRGWRTDLAALASLCHHHGALLCADVIQGLGVIPTQLAAWGVDFAMADAHKWMLGPEGIGVFYVAPTARRILRVTEPGWASVAHRMEWDNLDLVYDDSARRYEGGTYNLAGVAGMGASLELLAQGGADAVWSHVDGLCDVLCDGLAAAGATVLSDRSPGGRSAVVTARLADVEPALAGERLQAEGIVVSPRGGGIRISPHGWNTEEDIGRFLAALPGLTRAS